MFLGYIGAIAGGIGLAAVLLTISKIFRLNLPKWMYPAAAGIGMLALTINIEYTWYNQVRQNLTSDVEVVQTFEYSVFYQPWTYLVPRINRLVAVNHTSARTHPDIENVVLIDTVLMERLANNILATQFINCEIGGRLLFDEVSDLDSNGFPADPNWVEVGLDDPLIVSVCSRHLPADEANASETG